MLFILTVAFWHHSPPIRDNWVGLLGLALPIFALRVALFGRVWTYTPLLVLVGIFMLLTVWNFTAAPHHRALYLVLACRPLLGAWFVIFCAEHARLFKKLDALFVASLGIGAVVAVLALTSSQWNEKIAPLKFLVDAMPRIDYNAFLPDMLLVGFNPNEIAGAITWLCPLAAGIALYASKNQPTRYMLSLQIAAISVCVLLFLALFLGQSRFAIAGVIGALGGIVLFGVQQARWRYALLGVLVLVVMLQGALLANLIPTAGQSSGTPLSLNNRDEASVTIRLDIWRSALLMTRDYPLTGIGMAMFRAVVREPAYQIPYYEDRNAAPPHAHNEWLQITTDMGIPGLLLFLSWHVWAFWALVRVWRYQPALRSAVLAIAGGLLAHAFYGLGDAVTLWDRYQFVFWWLLALAAALDVIYRYINVSESAVELKNK